MVPWVPLSHWHLTPLLFKHPNLHFHSALTPGSAAGFSGSIVATQTFPNFAGLCAAVSCPLHSAGQNVPLGCLCNPGYLGIIGTSTTSPFFTGACVAQTCPVYSNGVDIASGCTCNSGYTGSVVAVQQMVNVDGTATAIHSTCERAPCPANSRLQQQQETAGELMFQCVCNNGYSGNPILPTTATPFWTSCVAVACPLTSTGPSVPLGCTCNNGFSGAVVL